MADPTPRILAAVSGPASSEALDILRLSVVDWMACGIAGQSEPVATVVAQMLNEEAGTEQATCFGGRRRPARAAALYNGTVSHALDYDDTHFAHIGHVSVAVLPAVFSMAERNDTTLAQTLKAGLSGCEAAIRMGIYLGRTHYQIGFHQTATSGCFGAALAAALMDGVDPTVRHHALGLAATRASGLKSQFGTMGKPYNAGLAASNGVEAALLAGVGMVADRDGWGAFAETHHADAADIGPAGFLMPKVSHKFHACCHGLHAALEAVRSLNVDPETVERIEIRTHPRWMSVCNKTAFATGLEAKFSYAAVMALSLLGYDTADPDVFVDRIVCLPEVLLLAGKTHVTADPQLSELQSAVRIGSQEATADLAEQLSFDDRAIRLRRKADTLVGLDRADQIWNVVFGDADQPVTALTELM